MSSFGRVLYDRMEGGRPCGCEFVISHVPGAPPPECPYRGPVCTRSVGALGGATADTDVDGGDDGSRAIDSGVTALEHAIALTGASGIIVESSRHGHRVLAADDRTV